MESKSADGLPHQCVYHVIYLSSIFKWYAGDFEKKGGSVLQFLKPFWSEPVRQQVEQGGFKVHYLEYDWSLNEEVMTSSKSSSNP